jgi:hypothetical protein
MNFKINNPKNDFDLDVKLTQSNGPLSTSQIVYQIVSHFVDHFANQNDKVQFDFPIMLNMYKMTCPNSQGGFFTLIIFGYFLTRKFNRKNHEL